MTKQWNNQKGGEPTIDKLKVLMPYWIGCDRDNSSADNYGVDMTEESDILSIVKEDILRILSEGKRRDPLNSIEPKVKVSSFFMSKALKNLRENNSFNRRNASICFGNQSVFSFKPFINLYFWSSFYPRNTLYNCFRNVH